MSVWAVKVDKEQSIVTFLVPAFFSFKFFSMLISKFKSSFCKLNEKNQDYKMRSLTWLKKGKEMNNVHVLLPILSFSAIAGR